MEVHPTEMSQGKNYSEDDLQRLKSTICEGAQKAESCFSSAGIYRVPRELRKLQKSAYTPRLIAIGPLHRNDKHLQTPMQHVKMSYTNHLLCRLTEGVGNLEQIEQEKLTILRECVAKMELLIDDAKKCYAQEVELNVEMMLVDGCFILELLYRKLAFRKREDLRRADPIFGNQLTAVNVHHDLLLLENQIPFLVLEKLFLLTVDRIPSNRLSLTNYLVRYFGKKMKPEGKSTDCVLRVYGNEMENSEPEEVPSRPATNQYHHILHKVHDGYLPPDQTEKINEHYEIMPSATELVYAGVKFVCGNKEGDLFKVKFNEPEGPFWWCRSARFEIPTLVMEDSTESFLRNFIAFEQCCPGVPQHFTSYAILMDMLVDSDKDVQVLEKAGVVRNLLGASEDATNLFNKLCKEVAEGEFFFADICNRAHNYRRSFWPKNIAHMRRQYFASPWRFIAFCLAFCAVGISITQFLRSFSSPQINNPG